VVNARPQPLHLQEKDPTPIVKKAGWATEPVWIGMEILPSPGFNPGTIQPIAGCYADYTILVTPKCVHNSVKGIHIIW